MSFPALLKSVAGLAVVAAVGLAHADDSSDLATKLTRMYPATQFDSVKPSPLPGLYEVVLGENIAYVEPTGRYFLFGRLFDMPNQVDVTGGRLDEVNKVQSGTFDIQDAIVTVRGNGKRKLYVFSDPDCPYCQKLEQDLKGVDDLTVYTFLMPLDNIHPDARRKAQNVWCAADRSAAWSDLMLAGREAPDADCKNPVQRVTDMARKLRISGTPTMFRDDGKKLVGAAGADRINAFLSENATAKAN